LNLDFKKSADSPNLMAGGRLFQHLSPGVEKARSPNRDLIIRSRIAVF